MKKKIFSDKEILDLIGFASRRELALFLQKREYRVRSCVDSTWLIEPPSLEIIDRFLSGTGLQYLYLNYTFVQISWIIRPTFLSYLVNCFLPDMCRAYNAERYGERYRCRPLLAMELLFGSK